jgi:hypothetical protein
MIQQKQPLQCYIMDGKLVISIGIDTLAWAAKKRNNGPIPNRFRVTDKTEWAKDVSRAIEYEDEAGNTMLHEMLDHAMRDAMDRGSCGLSYGKVT